MGFLDPIRGTKQYEGPTFPEFGVPFGEIKAGVGRSRLGQPVCWPLRVTQIRHERGTPAAPATSAWLDAEYEGYDVWHEKQAPFDWVEQTDSRLGHFYVEVVIRGDKRFDTLVPEANALIAANNTGAYPRASHVLVCGRLEGIDDHSRWAGPGAKISPSVEADEVLWEWWPEHARRYVLENPNYRAYRSSFNEQQLDPDRQCQIAVQAIREGWWSSMPS